MQCEELERLLRDAIQFFSRTHSSSRRLKLQVASRMTTSSSTVCCVVCYSWDVGGVETSFFGYAQDYRLSQQSALPCAGDVVLCLYSFFLYFKLTEILNHTWFAFFRSRLYWLTRTDDYSPRAIPMDAESLREPR